MAPVESGFGCVARGFSDTGRVGVYKPALEAKKLVVRRIYAKVCIDRPERFDPVAEISNMQKFTEPTTGRVVPDDYRHISA
jgi:hypothetical protein